LLYNNKREGKKKNKMVKKRFKTSPLKGGEIAPYADNPYLSYYYGGFPSSKDLNNGVILTPSDELLLEKGGVRALNMYTRLFYDSSVITSYNKLINDVISKELVVEANDSTNDKDKEIADYVKQSLNRLPMDETYRGLGESLITGISYGEIIWERKKGEVRAKDIRLKDPRRFIWEESKKYGYRLRIVSRKNPFNGILADDRKIIDFKYYVSNNGDPYGQGLGRILYPLVKFKRRALESLILYSDRYANPSVVVTAPLNSTEDEINLLYSQITNLSQEMALILPESFKYEFVTPSGQGNAIFKEIDSLIDKSISLLITGEDEAGNSSSGNRASSEVAQDVRSVKASELSQLISKKLERTLVRWIVDYNFGQEYEVPKIKRDFRLKEGSKLTVQDVVTLDKELKLRATTEWIANHFKVEFMPEEDREEAAGKRFTNDNPDEDLFESIFNSPTEEEEEEENLIEQEQQENEESNEQKEN